MSDVESAKKRLRQVADGATLQAVYSRGFYEAIGDRVRADIAVLLDIIMKPRDDT